MSLPPGLLLHCNFITPQEHDLLLRTIDEQPWAGVLAPGSRRVQQYGVKYDYMARDIDRSADLPPVPDWCGAIIDRLLEHGHMKKPAQQIIVNEYHPGQGITAHTDAPAFGPCIVSVSLGSACVMEFTRGDKKLELELPPRSALVLQGEARWNWKHCIPGRKTDVRADGSVLERTRRVSLTLRTIGS